MGVRKEVIEGGFAGAVVVSRFGLGWVVVLAGALGLGRRGGGY